jgi:hypothetical protein
MSATPCPYATYATTPATKKAREIKCIIIQLFNASICVSQQHKLQTQI